jgi:hypothetical protein
LKGREKNLFLLEIDERVCLDGGRRGRRREEKEEGRKHRF